MSSSGHCETADRAQAKTWLETCRCSPNKMKITVLGTRTRNITIRITQPCHLDKVRLENGSFKWIYILWNQEGRDQRIPGPQLATISVECTLTSNQLSNTRDFMWAVATLRILIIRASLAARKWRVESTKSISQIILTTLTIQELCIKAILFKIIALWGVVLSVKVPILFC